MGAIAYSANLTFVHVTCASCGVVWGLEQGYQNRKKETGEGFTCPNGHSNVYRGQSEADKLRRDLEQEKKRREWAESSRDSAQRDAKRQYRRTVALRGVVTKTRKRVGNGVCPCCNRTFKQLAAHMKTKHPTYKVTKRFKPRGGG